MISFSRVLGKNREVERGLLLRKNNSGETAARVACSHCVGGAAVWGTGLGGWTVKGCILGQTVVAAQAPPSRGSQPNPCSPGFGALLTADGTSEPWSKGGRTCLAWKPAVGDPYPSLCFTGGLYRFCSGLGGNVCSRRRGIMTAFQKQS